MIRRESFLRIHQQHPEIKQMKTWKRTAITLSIHLSSKCFLNFSCKERKTNLIFVFTEKLDPEFRQEPQRDCAEVPPGTMPETHPVSRRDITSIVPDSPARQLLASIRK